jgi:glutamate synthase domain-containing protein 2/CDGSH-type Zn-finger protein
MEPSIADTKPKAVMLEAGKTYHFCRCGRSASQPFCDGSHAGTRFTALAFVAERDGEAQLCQCKRTANAPYCDGTHARLDAALVARHRHVALSGPPPAVPTVDEPTVAEIHELARNALANVGHHGRVAAMGVPGHQLPRWDDLQMLVAQLARRPLADDAAVDTELVIGPRARRPLRLAIPILVSDMSFGALSEEAKVALARGAERAGTGICSGEGGMLPEEQAENSRYLYELASAKFGFHDGLLDRVQAFHFKGGQGAKTGTGGHLPGSKVTGKIAEVRGLPEGEPAISPATFEDLRTAADFLDFGERVRELTDGVPVGFKLSANHIEHDIDFALEAGADYIILDGRGGGTGAAPLIFRDNISVPTIPALARARRHLDASGRDDVTLIITGGLRMPADFVKALALGADGIAIANSAMQAVGCVAARMCDTNQCPAGVATQRPELRARLVVDEAAERLARFLAASVSLMVVLARACGHPRMAEFSLDDLSTWKREMAELSGVRYVGVGV